jgi:hypothetical protein
MMANGQDISVLRGHLDTARTVAASMKRLTKNQ